MHDFVKDNHQHWTLHTCRLSQHYGYNVMSENNPVPSYPSHLSCPCVRGNLRLHQRGLFHPGLCKEVFIQVSCKQLKLKCYLCNLAVITLPLMSVNSLPINGVSSKQSSAVFSMYVIIKPIRNTERSTALTSISFLYIFLKAQSGCVCQN